MKFLRWLVIGMLATSILAVLVAAAFWWVTWPNRTAKAFVDLLAAEKYEEMIETFGGETYYDDYSYYRQPLFPHEGQIRIAIGIKSHGRFDPRWRSLNDLIVGRQEFSYGEYGHEGSVTFQRGKVVYITFPTY